MRRLTLDELRGMPEHQPSSVLAGEHPEFPLTTALQHEVARSGTAYEQGVMLTADHLDPAVIEYMAAHTDGEHGIGTHRCAPLGLIEQQKLKFFSEHELRLYLDRRGMGDTFLRILDSVDNLYEDERTLAELIHELGLGA